MFIEHSLPDTGDTTMDQTDEVSDLLESWTIGETANIPGKYVLG